MASVTSVSKPLSAVFDSLSALIANYVDVSLDQQVRVITSFIDQFFSRIPSSVHIPKIHDDIWGTMVAVPIIEFHGGKILAYCRRNGRFLSIRRSAYNSTSLHVYSIAGAVQRYSYRWLMILCWDVVQKYTSHRVE